jgi:hypothetical protein
MLADTGMLLQEKTGEAAHGQATVFFGNTV